MTLAAFQSLWCHNGILASVTSPTGDVDGRLELQLHLSATRPDFNASCLAKWPWREADDDDSEACSDEGDDASIASGSEVSEGWVGWLA